MRNLIARVNDKKIVFKDLLKRISSAFSWKGQVENVILPEYFNFKDFFPIWEYEILFE